MALIVEDGSNVAGANSYCTIAELREYAIKRGTTLTASDSLVEIYATKAIDYLEAKRSDFKGTKSYSDQALQWPRTDVVIDGIDFPVDAIPIELKNAQAQLVVEVATGNDLMPTVAPGGFVLEEQVGALKTVYSNKLRTSSKPKFEVVSGFLSAITTIGSRLFRSYRV